MFTLARTAPVDPSSDWYAPVEHWGNYEGLAVIAAPPVKRDPAANKVRAIKFNSDAKSKVSNSSRILSASFKRFSVLIF